MLELVGSELKSPEQRGLEAEKIVRRSGTSWSSEESCETCVTILDGVRFDHYKCPPLFRLSEPAKGKSEERSW